MLYPSEAKVPSLPWKQLAAPDPLAMMVFSDVNVDPALELRSTLAPLRSPDPGPVSDTVFPEMVDPVAEPLSEPPTVWLTRIPPPMADPNPSAEPVTVAAVFPER